MPKRINIASLSNEDVSAITSALPLVLQFTTNSEEQDMINQTCVQSAGMKLITRNKDFSPNEIRMIYVAVGLAKDYLSGHLDLELEADEKSELKKHFFTYNRLFAVLDPFFE